MVKTAHVYGRSAALLAALLLVAGPVAADTDFSEVVKEVQTAVGKGQLAGAVLHVSIGGRTVLQTAVGYRDREAGVALKEDDLFRQYSLTKPVTTVVALQMVEEGKLKLDQPVADLFPELKNMKVGKPVLTGLKLIEPTRPMTVRDLMRHSSGLIYPWGISKVDRRWKDAGLGGGFSSTRDFIQRLAKAPLKYHPGSTWNYSMSTDLLGAVIEKADGRDLEAAFQARVLRPLKMKDTSFWAPKSKHPRLAADYLPGLTKKAVRKKRVSTTTGGSNFMQRPRFFSGGGGLVSTAPDMARFYNMLAGGGSLDGVSILKPATIQEMTRSQVKGIDMSIGKRMSVGDSGFGLGVNRLPAPATGTMTHGWAGLSGTAGWFDPEKNIVGVFMVHIYNQRPQIAFRTAVYKAIAKGGKKRP